jgi:RNA polymerase sigma factor (TIGR02999 family)
MTTSTRVTRLLQRSRDGDGDALEEILPLLYRELRRIAAEQLSRERGGHTLQATALVHEAWLQLVAQRSQSWENRRHFLSLAAMTMRRVLVHHAERRAAAKRGGGLERVTLSSAGEAVEAELPDLLDLEQALERLGAVDERAVRIVELRFFAGLTCEEAGEVLGLSTRTVEREWRVARAWLRRELGDEEG